MNAGICTTPPHPVYETDKHNLEDHIEVWHPKHWGRFSMPTTGADSNKVFFGTEGKHGDSLERIKIY